MASREVFYKQRIANIYLISPHVLDWSVVQVLLALAESYVLMYVVY